VDEHKAYLYGLAAGDPRPALLDQMGFGSCVLVRDSKVNLEVIDGAGESFERHRPVAALRAKLQKPLAAPQRVEALRPLARRRIETYYNWEWVTSFYEDLFGRLMAGRDPVSYDAFLEQRPAGEVAEPVRP
jgi:glycosyltransferase involved in cell wall biosynthesis